MLSTRGKEMLGYLPWYYQESEIMQAILESQGVEIDDLRQALLESLSQFYVDTTDWGIERWEKELGITPPSDDLDLRRAIVKAKLLRPPTMTPAQIKAIADCFTQDKSTKVIEVNNDYTFKLSINFDTVLWLGEMKKAINEAKPAHLAMVIEYYAQFLDNYPELRTKHFLNCAIPSLVDRITWKGRSFDGGWCYTAPTVYGGTWNLDGQYRYDGAVPGDDDQIIAGSRFDSSWRLDGSKTFVLANPTRKVSFYTEEPENLITIPKIGQSDTHGVVLLFDGSRRQMDGQHVFGAMTGAQDANDVAVAAIMRQSDELAITETTAMKTAALMKDNYPLPRMQYFSGAWAFGQPVMHDGGRWFGSGEKYDGLPGLPDPAAKPNLLDGHRCFDGKSFLGAPGLVVAFGADANASDKVSLDIQLADSETVSLTEAASVKVTNSVEDFAYADIRMDGSFEFAQPACFDGFWLQSGAQLYDGVQTAQAKYLKEPEPLTGMYNGQSSYNGGADAAYDGAIGFDVSPIDAAITRFGGGRILHETENFIPCLTLQETIAHATSMDGTTAFDGSWDLSQKQGPCEQEQDEITIGRWFGGGWQFDAGNTLLFGGTWDFDGSYLHAIRGDCRNHFDGSMVLDGKTVFWKGGETFEHYRYAAN